MPTGFFLHACRQRACDWSDPGVQALPSGKEQTAAIYAARENALRFGDSLPDFICTQINRRWVGKPGKKATIDFGDARMSDLPQVTVGEWRVMVFRFRVAVANSQWRLSYGSQQTVTGIDGLVYIESTHDWVVKVKVNADRIPKEFPIQRSGVELDYRSQTVADREFLLPIRALEWNDSREVSTRNEVEFRRYRRFSIDSKIDYETPPPLPANEIKEVTEK